MVGLQEADDQMTYQLLVEASKSDKRLILFT